MSWETGGYSWDEDQALWDAEERSQTVSLGSALLQLQSKTVSSSVALAQTQMLETSLQKLLLKMQNVETMSDAAVQASFEIVATMDSLISRDTDKRVTVASVLLKVMFLTVLLESALKTSTLTVTCIGEEREVTSSPLRFKAINETTQSLENAVKRGTSSHEIGLRFVSETCERFSFWFTENPNYVLEVAGYFSLEVAERLPVEASESGAVYEAFANATEVMPYVAQVDNFLYLAADVDAASSLGRKDFASMYITFDEVA